MNMEQKADRGAGLSRRSFVATLGALAAMGAVRVSNASDSPKAARAEEGRKLSFTPGTYEGKALGKNGYVYVKATFDETSLTDIEIGENYETHRISDAAFDLVPQRIIEAQSSDVDSVTGASLTSYAIKAAVEDCVEQAGGDVKAFGSAPQAPSEPVPAEQDVDCDIVIVGAGGSGMGTAIESSIKGAGHVVLLEKNSLTGGNTLVSGGYLDYVNAPDELKQDNTPGYDQYFESVLTSEFLSDDDADAVELIRGQHDAYVETGDPKTFDSLEYYALDFKTCVAGGLSYDDCYSIARSGVFATEFLTGIGAEWEPLVGIAGYAWPRFTVPKDSSLGYGYYQLFDQWLADNHEPVDIRLDTRATKLIVEDGKVTGVQATGENGAVTRFHSAHGVVLATGGFAGNPELLKKYDKTWGFAEQDVIPTTNNYGHTGDGLTMALECGADAVNLGTVEVFPLIDPKTYSVENIVGNSSTCLMVGPNGKRFCNENGDRPQIVKGMMANDPQVGYMISDATNCMISEDGICYTGARIDNELAVGHVGRADTLEELAEYIGCDPDTFVATVDAYNGMVESGEDPEFGRVIFDESCRIATPPFYACPRTWGAHDTKGGLVVDEGYRVLTKDREPIEGLYAVGEVVNALGGVSAIGNGVEVADIIFG